MGWLYFCFSLIVLGVIATTIIMVIFPSLYILINLLFQLIILAWSSYCVWDIRRMKKEGY